MLRLANRSGSCILTKSGCRMNLRIPYLLLKSARPRQWIKNVALFAPLFFSGFLFYDPADGLPYIATVTFAAIIFTVLTSSIYIINDILDREADAKHPFKKKRPLASGELPAPIALFTAITGLAVVFFLSLPLSSFFKLMLALYFLLQMLYAKFLKHFPIWDVLTIASGFLIRTYAGSVVVNLHMSVWFLLTVVSASLFLAVAKRQSERTLLGETQLGETRKTLKKYSQRLLDQYTSMFATATWLTYALYTFQTTLSDIEPAFERFPELYIFLPRTLQSQKLLMLTIPFVIIGVMRYLHLIYEENKGESPERIILRDKTLLSVVTLLALTTFVVIYM